jgi:curved DNA-binding protein
VPAGINSGRSLRLKGKGWPLRQGRGDLLLTIQVQIPSELNPEEKLIYEKLRQLRQSLKLNPRDKLVVNGIL